MRSIRIEAPWYNLRKKLDALLGQDPDITVSEVYEAESDEADYVVDVEVKNHEKFVALDRVMIKCHTFGNVRLAVRLYDEENSNSDSDCKLYSTIFNGNPIVEDVKTIVDKAGTSFGYVRFKPEVVQFFDDNLCDYNGNWTGLAQDIASEIFDNGLRRVYFCTAAKK